MQYATGMQGFMQWLAADPAGSQLYEQVANPIAATASCYWNPAGSCCSPDLSPIPSDAVGSAALAPQASQYLATAITSLPSCQQAAATATVSTQLAQAAAGQPPLNIGLLYMGPSRIQLGDTCFTFGATSLSGGDLLLVLAGGALVVGLLLWHRKG